MSTETFGTWLETQRRRRKLTQRTFGEAAGLAPSYVSKIENGHIILPDDETRARIHAALGTSEDDLVAVGILERIDSPVPGGEPVYIAAESITPGDRAAAEAHQAIHVVPEPGLPWVIERSDPRAALLDVLATATPDQIGFLTRMAQATLEFGPKRG